jgi:hypothetical protein
VKLRLRTFEGSKIILDVRMHSAQGGGVRGRTLFVPRTQCDIPRSQTRWITGMPTDWSARLDISEKPAFWLNPDSRVDELKKNRILLLRRQFGENFLRNGSAGGSDSAPIAFD